ncbi:MAG TPA: RNA polymerase sigma factor [Armatimonadota bacterium]|jgi:RNA polymerase sigma-70 factor (ECF subfamily)
MYSAGQPTNGIRSDGELVREAQQGAPGAFDALFDRHYAKVFHFALQMDGSRDNAADIAQTAFVKAYGALPRMRDGQALLAFLYRVSLNIVRDRAKSARRKPWIRLAELWHGREGEETGPEPSEMADPSLDPQGITIAVERDAALRTAIQALPLEFREVVVLHHIEAMDVREIAGLLGVPEGTVKSRLGRARGRLRAAMAPWAES